jgi:hypothetical protein
MDDQLKGFFRRLLDQAIHSAIHTIFWKMPLGLALMVLALLIGVALYFKLY